jgi:hypothetical protein
MNNPPTIIEIGQGFIGNYPIGINNAYNPNSIKNRQIVQLKGNVRKPTVRTISSKIERVVDQAIGNFVNDDKNDIKFIRKLEKRSTIEAKQNPFNFNNINNGSVNINVNNGNKNDSNGNNDGNVKKVIPLNKVLNRPGSYNV